MKRTSILTIATLCVFLCAVGVAQNLQMKVTYICNGERLIIDGCDIHDMSDTAHCFVAHPDRPLHNGMMAYTNETRGTLNKLIPTCKPPNAEEVRKHEEFERAIAASQQKAVDDQRAWVAAHQPQQQGPSEDQQAINRCVSAGRSTFDCLGETMKKEVGDMLGAVDPSLKKMMTTEPGLRVNGIYKGAGFGLLFPQDQDTVALSCPPLVTDSYPYTVVNGGSQIVVKVANSPQPLIFRFNQAGLIGPGLSTVNGRVVVGTRHWIRHWSDGRDEPMSEPIYEARTVRCNAGTLPLAGPAPKVGLGAITDLGFFQSSEKSVTNSKNFKVPAGLRLIGDYVSPTGFNVDFRRESATVGCGQAVSAHSYTIQSIGNQLVARIGEDAGPITLVLQPDGRISGSGQVQINGRQIQGSRRDASDNDHLVFGATSGTCAIGTLALRNAGPSEFERGANAARASMGPVGAGGGAAPVPSAHVVSQPASPAAGPPPGSPARQLFNQGISYIQTRDFPHAVEAFKKTIALQPDMAAAHYGLGMSYLMMNRFPDAENSLQQSVRLQPNRVDVLATLGMAYVQDGKKAEAMQVYRNLSALDKNAAQQLYAMISQKMK